jgi:hypothetical protein
MAFPSDTETAFERQSCNNSNSRVCRRTLEFMTLGMSPCSSHRAPSEAFKCVILHVVLHYTLK